MATNQVDASQGARPIDATGHNLNIAGVKRARVPLSKSLSFKFISVIVPLFLVVFVASVGFYEWNRFDKACEALERRLQTMAASQSIIIASPVADKDPDRLSVLLASVVSDQDLVGIAVYDTNGNTLDSFGNLDNPKEELHQVISINYADETGIRKVGVLELVMTDERLHAELNERLIDDAILVTVLLLALSIGAIVTHRVIVMRPLDQLRHAINETAGGHSMQVNWESDDEIGQLIKSYNRMQERLGDFANRLHLAHSQLEKRVEDRTHELVLARDQAEEANRAKSRFLTSMTHELRTPMNAIMGFTQLIQMDPDLANNKRVNERLHAIERGANHLMSLVEQILDLSNMDASQEDVRVTKLEPTPLIRECVELLGPLADARDITITVDESVLRTGKVMADELGLRQAVLNILSNAIKYNREGGSVKVMGERRNDGVILSFTDTGHGIPKEKLNAVFEPFNRLGREAGVIEGSGIGMTITRTLIEGMDGDIDVVSTEGEGSTFSIILRADNADAKAPA